MTTHAEFCMAMAKKAGWTGKAAEGIVSAARSATLAGFPKQLDDANEIRGLLSIIGPSMKASGYDVDGALQDFIAKGISPETVRTETAKVLAEADEAASINTAKLNRPAADPYAARAAEIDEHKGKSRA